MTKRATNPKVTAIAAPTRRVKQPQERTTKSIGMGDGSAPSELSQSVLSEARQSFSSEEQALSFLLNSVIEKLGDGEKLRGGGAESTQLHEFLKLVLETDPDLREQVLSGIAIRK